jgi:fumarylacetoacetase
MSFIKYAADCEFPIQNLPWGIFSVKDTAPRAGIAIGDKILDCKAVADADLFDGPILKAKAKEVFAAPTLNAFSSLGKAAWTEARARITSLLTDAPGPLRDNQALQTSALIPMSECQMHLPFTIGDYTDFYSSREHASNVGSMFRDPKNPLLPNWLHLPVGYHGRASSVIISGTPVTRPLGQLKADNEPAPTFGACRLLDFEVEMGFFTDDANALGKPLSLKEAEDHIFGLVLLNDWSARDIQKWEYVPLGPFGAKNFASTISPWVVTLEALAPFRVPSPAQVDPLPLPYIRYDDAAHDKAAFDLHLTAAIKSPAQEEDAVVCHTNFKYMYWTCAQQLVHHTVTGCNMRSGDLLGSGTISGPEPSEFGSMLELSWRGSKEVSLNGKEIRKFIKDGDEVIMRGWCQGDGYKVGFGEARGLVLPAPTNYP